jgi:hypothetical protein
VSARFEGFCERQLASQSALVHFERHATCAVHAASPVQRWAMDAHIVRTHVAQSVVPASATAPHAGAPVSTAASAGASVEPFEEQPTTNDATSSEARGRIRNAG